MMKDSYDVSYVNNGFDENGLKGKPDSFVTIKKKDSEPDETKKVANTTVSQDPERPQWDNQCEFILSAVGYAVGLGNVWRFPYLAYTNGGGTFLIPYALMLFSAGLPLFFMELSLGQYSGQGPTRVFGRLAPALKGLGFAMLMITAYVSIYYNVIIAWTLFYMFSGMQSELPWTTCNSGTSSYHCQEPCVDVIMNTTMPLNMSTTMSPMMSTMMPPNMSAIMPPNITVCDYIDGFIDGDPYIASPSEDYYTHAMLGLDKKVHDWKNLGGLRWQLVLCLLGAWTIVCLCLIKGVQSAGKVVYFTGRFPFL